MGKTNPTIAERIDAWVAEFEAYRDGLRYENQDRFDRLVSRAKLHRVATDNQNPIEMHRVMFLNMLLAMQRELDTVREEELVNLEKRVQILEQKAWDETDLSRTEVPEYQ